MEIRINPSDPQFAEIDRLTQWLARLKNPACWWGMEEMPEIERLVAIKDLEDALEEMSH
jgi:hypothetical protein